MKFEDSIKTGIHYKLNSLCGEWSGITKTWFEPDKLADESPMNGKIKTILGGRFILYEYNGSLKGKPYEGIAIFGYNFIEDKFECAWVDSFHMGTGIMFSEGKKSIEEFSATGSYGTGDESQPKWFWRTEIEIVNPDKIIITAYNITPEKLEAKATETVYTRVK